MQASRLTVAESATYTCRGPPAFPSFDGVADATTNRGKDNGQEE
jgi:hypothetical protein